jgi:carbon storage regulator
MLVLTRRPEDGLVLTLPGTGEQVQITVLGVEGDKVKLGITAPQSVTILRRELCEAVREQNLAAARQAPAGLPVDLLRQLLAQVPAASEPGRPETGS